MLYALAFGGKAAGPVQSVHGPVESLMSLTQGDGIRSAHGPRLGQLARHGRLLPYFVQDPPVLMLGSPLYDDEVLERFLPPNHDGRVRIGEPLQDVFTL